MLLKKKGKPPNYIYKIRVLKITKDYSKVKC